MWGRKRKRATVESAVEKYVQGKRRTGGKCAQGGKGLFDSHNITKKKKKKKKGQEKKSLFYHQTKEEPRRIWKVVKRLRHLNTIRSKGG